MSKIPSGPDSAWDNVRETARLKHLSLRTEQAYLHWIKRLWIFHGRRGMSNFNAEEIRSFLAHLAVHEHVSASTQNQALCAILFLYRDVLKIEIPWIEGIEKPRPRRRLPVVFTHQEALSVLHQ